jgi:hypothetical protein
LQLVVVLLGCGKRIMHYWHGDCLNREECVGDSVVLSGYVVDVGRKLGDKLQMVKLTWGAFVSLLVEGECERLVVRHDAEVLVLQHVSKVPHCLADRKELPVVCTVFLLCQAQLPGEKGEGLANVLHALLQDGTHGGG